MKITNKNIRNEAVGLKYIYGHWFVYSNEFRELSRHYDVIVEPNYSKFNDFSQLYLLCLSSL